MKKVLGTSFALAAALCVLAAPADHPSRLGGAQTPEPDRHTASVDEPRTMALLHSFSGGTNDGAYPYSQSTTLVGSTLYGMTSSGGDFSAGVIFSIGADGTGFTLLHEFSAGASDGGFPFGSLVSDGSTLYGMASFGGSFGLGVIFSIALDGTGFTLLHEFTGGADDGREPHGSLTLDGSTLFGMTAYGGDSEQGVIFSIATNGTGFTLLREFAGGASDGGTPFGSLTLDGSTLFGMTYGGGDSGFGTVFSIATNGTGFTLLHEFAGGTDDGKFTYGSLALGGSTLFGMTLIGGDLDHGVIFSIATDGAGFTLLHEFMGGVDGGTDPHGSLALAGSTLFGMTLDGGAVNRGVLFSIATDGTQFGLLHEFAGPPGDGDTPYYGEPLVVGSSVYGMTQYGGASLGGALVGFDIVIPPFFVDGFESGDASAWESWVP